MSGLRILTLPEGGLRGATEAARARRAARAACPFCGARVRAALVGRNRHLRLACETDGCIRVLE